MFKDTRNIVNFEQGIASWDLSLYFLKKIHSLCSPGVVINFPQCNNTEYKIS